ncbi:ribonuclease H-like domain-containing protein [Mycena maculata]|uniref:3'-5' exonuclease n=1 Tax=Mycena maculata TaxID=230809 RepID=A0AAD7JB16_9AGAR|nr:ribonuclease H-like domain-containing protein [Mycena maculata]
MSKKTATVPPPPKLIPYDKEGEHYYITDEIEVNTALAPIVHGRIGFDTEFYDNPDKLNAKILAELTPSGVPWKRVKLCTVQVAVIGAVYVINIKKMQAFPAELRRLLASDDVLKVGVGLAADGKVIWDGVAAYVQHFVDVGLMIKYANPELYENKDQNPLSLKCCVAQALNKALNKGPRRDNWNSKLTHEQIKYAALDAQASLQVYDKAVELLEAQAKRLGRPVPEDWYKFDFRAGVPTRHGVSARNFKVTTGKD